MVEDESKSAKEEVISMEDRTKGFVVGGDPCACGKGKVWKVRIKHPGHPDDGDKLIVASVRKGSILKAGLPVTFIIGGFGPEENKKAVDVMISSIE